MQERASRFAVRYTDVQKNKIYKKKKTTLTRLSNWKASFLIQPADSSAFFQKSVAFSLLHYTTWEYSEKWSEIRETREDTVKPTEQ